MTDRAVTRPGGRAARVRTAVLNAADQAIADGVDPVTVRVLAESSGISEPTIYRRWRTAENVLLDAAVRHLTRALPVMATGKLAADLTAWATNLDRGLGTPTGLRFLAVVINARARPVDDATDTVRSFLQLRIDQLEALLASDQAPADLTVERLLDHVLAPLYVRHLFGYPTPPELPQQLVLELLAQHS